MKSRVQVFNGFLLLLAFALATGCGSTEERRRKKELSNIRIHVEGDTRSDQAAGVSVFRSSPMRLNVEREPILDENNVVAATVEPDAAGGFVVRVKFDRQGSWILERATVVNRGKRLAIHGYFGEERWLAAPEIRAKNSTGSITFTPDASREEAERFVRGLNNVARKLNQRENWPFSEPFDK